MDEHVTGYFIFARSFYPPIYEKSEFMTKYTIHDNPIDDFTFMLDCKKEDLRFREAGSFNRTYLIVYDGSKTREDDFYSVRCWKDVGKKKKTTKYKEIYGNAFIFRLEVFDNGEEYEHRIIDIDHDDENMIGLSKDFEFFSSRCRDCILLSENYKIDGLHDKYSPVLILSGVRYEKDKSL